MREHRLERWAEVVRALSLDLSQPVTLVEASSIKQSTGEEPRLLGKIDTREELPAVFRRHGVFVLPVANGRYALIHGEGYHDLEPAPPPVTFTAALPFALTTSRQGLSEMQYLDYAYNSGLVEHACGAGRLFLTLRGRKFTPPFQFRVAGGPLLRAESVQVEVDGGFEGAGDVVVVEGKIGAPANFLIRQLYYPYRWLRQAAPEKRVRPIFFTFQAETRRYTFWEYAFADDEDYASLTLARCRSYAIAEGAAPLKLDDAAMAMRAVPGIIPQADDMERVLAFPFRVAEGVNTSKLAAEEFAIAERQSRYYREAAEALGLVTRHGAQYELTDAGQEYVRLPAPARNALACRLMLRVPIMHEVLIELCLNPERALTLTDLAHLIERRSPLTGATTVRRAETLLAWFRWVQRATGTVVVEHKGVRLRSLAQYHLW